MRTRWIPAAMTALAIALALSPAYASPDRTADPALRPGHAVEAALSHLVPARAQSDVMVLGTAHLSAFRDWLEPQHLEAPLALLERFAPTRIAVERIPPDEIALLAERAPHDPAAQQVLDQFAKSIATHGRMMQEALGIDRTTAERLAEATLDGVRDLDTPRRLTLIAQLLAAYEFDSAALQWSYLPPSARDTADGLPADVRDALDRRLQGTDEIARMAMPLARRLGLQRLYPVDSQYEGVRTHRLPSEALSAASQRAWGDTWRQSDAFLRAQAADQRARESGDLLALIRHLNSYEAQIDDATQWSSWLTMDHPDGLDRFRYAMWELRNQRMAAHVLDATVSTTPERVLFIVGASHKSYVERALAPNLGIRLVQPTAYEHE